MRIPKTNRKRPPKNFLWTSEMIMEIISRYAKEGPDELAKEFGVTKSTVMKVATKLGLHTNAGHRRWGRTREENNSSYDLHYFDQWSPNMAYVLGFLFADGSINKALHGFGATVKTPDESILLFLQKELKAEKGIYRTPSGYCYPCGEVNKSGSTSLGISSSYLAKKLVSLGMKPRKTYNDDPPPEVPDEMFPHFLRGLFDGDGSASSFESGKKGHGVISCCVNICGSVKLMTWVRDNLVRLAGLRLAEVRIKKGKTCDFATVTWGAFEDVKKFHSFIYKDMTFCLERKKKVLDDWLARPHRLVRPRVPWTVGEEKIVRELYHTLGPTGLTKILDRDKATISNKAKELGLQLLGIGKRQISNKMEIVDVR